MSENGTRTEVVIWMKRLKRARKFNRTKLANTRDTLGKVWCRFGCVKSHRVKGQMRQAYPLRMFYVSSRKPSSEKPATEQMLNMSEPRGRSHLGSCCPPSLWANLTGHPPFNTKTHSPFLWCSAALSTAQHSATAWNQDETAGEKSWSPFGFDFVN